MIKPQRQAAPEGRKDEKNPAFSSKVVEILEPADYNKTMLLVIRLTSLAAIVSTPFDS
ncbi:hypothetical protein Hanom_Chr04g00300061 [Helianthus anomalus]